MGQGGISDYNFDNFLYSMIVPVEFVSFSGIPENDGIRLAWETATELNNNGFEIERRDSLEDWKSFGFVKGKGSTAVPNKYTFSDKSVENGKKYKYRLKQIDLNGNFEYSSEIDITANLVSSCFLSQNYPNPFNPTTTINYSVSQTENVAIRVYSVLGEEVATLVNQTIPAGNYNVKFDGSGYPSGVYIYEIGGQLYFTCEDDDAEITFNSSLVIE